MGRGGLSAHPQRHRSGVRGGIRGRWSRTRAPSLGRAGCVVAGAIGDARPDQRVGLHTEVDDDGCVIDLHRPFQHCVDVLGTVTRQTHAAECLSQQGEVRDQASTPGSPQIHVAEPVVVVEGLQLPHHPRDWLLMIATLIGILLIAQVASSWFVI